MNLPESRPEAIQLYFQRGPSDTDEDDWECVRHLQAVFAPPWRLDSTSGTQGGDSWGRYAWESTWCVFHKYHALGVLDVKLTGARASALAETLTRLTTPMSDAECIELMRTRLEVEPAMAASVVSFFSYAPRLSAACGESFAALLQHESSSVRQAVYDVLAERYRPRTSDEVLELLESGAATERGALLEAALCAVQAEKAARADDVRGGVPTLLQYFEPPYQPKTPGPSSAFEHALYALVMGKPLPDVDLEALRPVRPVKAKRISRSDHETSLENGMREDAIFAALLALYGEQEAFDELLRSPPPFFASPKRNHDLRDEGRQGALLAWAAITNDTELIQRARRCLGFKEDFPMLSPITFELLTLLDETSNLFRCPAASIRQHLAWLLTRTNRGDVSAPWALLAAFRSPQGVRGLVELLRGCASETEVRLFGDLDGPLRPRTCSFDGEMRLLAQRVRGQPLQLEYVHALDGSGRIENWETVRSAFRRYLGESVSSLIPHPVRPVPGKISKAAIKETLSSPEGTLAIGVDLGGAPVEGEDEVLARAAELVPVLAAHVGHQRALYDEPVRCRIILRLIWDGHAREFANFSPAS